MVFEVSGVNWQLRALDKHSHAASFGVGGKLVEASQVEFCWGHAGNPSDGEEPCEGLFGGFTCEY